MSSLPNSKSFDNVSDGTSVDLPNSENSPGFACLLKLSNSKSLCRSDSQQTPATSASCVEPANSRSLCRSDTQRTYASCLDLPNSRSFYENIVNSEEIWKSDTQLTHLNRANLPNSKGLRRGDTHDLPNSRSFYEDLPLPPKSATCFSDDDIESEVEHPESAPLPFRVIRCSSDIWKYTYWRQYSSSRVTSSDGHVSDDNPGRTPHETIFAIQKRGSITIVSQRDEKVNPVEKLLFRSFSDGVIPPATDIVWKTNFGKKAPVIQEFKPAESKISRFRTRRDILAGRFSPYMIWLSDDVPKSERTTVMMRNLPNKYTRDTLLHLLRTHGFYDFDFFYLPIDFRSKSNMGYAFINFLNPVSAMRFKSYFSEFRCWDYNSVKACEVTWSRPFQGLAAHIDRYRNSPMMHSSVPAEFKPCLFQDGDFVPFPEPTKPVEAPKIRRMKLTRSKDEIYP